MVQIDKQLVVENLPSISYQEQIPEHSEIILLESVNVSEEKSNEEPLTRNLEQAPISFQINSMDINTQDSYSEEIQAVSEKSKNTEPQVGQNVEKVRYYQKQNMAAFFYYQSFLGLLIKMLTFKKVYK